MIGAFAAAPAPPSRAIVDPGLLTYRDRAALRILYRTDVATTTQLATLVYHRRQTAQERLARLYRAGYLERAVLPPVTRGGAPFAFRISPRGRRRLHYGPLTRGRAGTQLRHSLNGVETVCALLAAQQGEPDPGPVMTAWLTESMCHDTLRGVYPDGIVAVAGPSGSAVLCLEIDEATEHGPVIEDKLARYEKALWSRTWCVLFVTGSPERAARLAAIGRRIALHTIRGILTSPLYRGRLRDGSAANWDDRRAARSAGAMRGSRARATGATSTRRSCRSCWSGPAWVRGTSRPPRVRIAVELGRSPTSYAWPGSRRSANARSRRTDAIGIPMSSSRRCASSTPRRRRLRAVRSGRACRPMRSAATSRTFRRGGPMRIRRIGGPSRRRSSSGSACSGSAWRSSNPHRKPWTTASLRPLDLMRSKWSGREG